MNIIGAPGDSIRICNKTFSWMAAITRADRAGDELAIMTRAQPRSATCKKAG